MKEIKLKKIELHNFRGKAEQTIEFKDGFTTVISGRNASGKSRVFNAFVWCLFGKDTLDRKDYNVKTCVDGVEVKKTDVAVTVTLSVDGNTKELTRVLKEKWTKPRGQVDEVFSGNVTECYIDQVPTKVGDYAKEVDGIVSENLFKIITQTSFFVNMPWQQQREILLEMAGAVDYADIAVGNAGYSELLNRITGKTLEDYRKEVANNKRLQKKALEDIQPRINQTKKLMPEKADETQINAELDYLNAKLKSIEQQRTASQSEKEQKQRENKAKVSALNAEITALQKQQKEVVDEKQTTENERCKQFNKDLDAVLDGIEAKKKEADSLNDEIGKYQNKLSDAREDIEECDKKMAKLRTEWQSISAQEMSEGDTICKACGQPLPASRIEEVRNNYAAEKKKKLDEINTKGKRFKAEKTDIEANILDYTEKIKAAKEKLAVAVAEQKKLEESIKGKKRIEPVQIAPPSVPTFNKLQGEIDAKKKEVESLLRECDGCNQLNIADADTDAKVEAIKGAIKYNESILSDQRLREKYTEEIENLEAQGRQIAEIIARYERDEYTATQMIKDRIEECEKRINAMFNGISFKLFNYTIDGNPVETCIPLVDGIPYPVVNKANRLNAALSIIETLSHHYDVCAPIFIDDAEGVNNINPTTAQQIHLQVTDKDFEVTYF